MNRFVSRRPSCLGLLLPLLFPLASAAEELTFNTEEYPPYNFTNTEGEIEGTATRLLQAALDEAGMAAQFRVLPWARAYTEARLREDTCVYSTVRTAEREAAFRWVGPLVDTDWAAFALDASTIDAGDLDALAGLRVGSYREDAVGRFVESHGIPILLAATDRENALRLEAGLIDVWVTGEATARHVAGNTGVPIKRLFTFHQTDMYLACHPGVPGSLLSRLQDALDRLRDSDHHDGLSPQALDGEAQR